MFKQKCEGREEDEEQATQVPARPERNNHHNDPGVGAVLEEELHRAQQCFRGVNVGRRSSQFWMWIEVIGSWIAHRMEENEVRQRGL